jgi:hypothetical protein
MNVGDFAASIETGWFGKIVAIETDGNGDVMCEMIGVDQLALIVAGLTREEALSEDDVRWFSPDDLVPLD